MKDKKEEMLQQLLLDLLHIAEDENDTKQPLKPIMEQYVVRIETYLKETESYPDTCKK